MKKLKTSKRLFLKRISLKNKINKLKTFWLNLIRIMENFKQFCSFVSLNFLLQDLILTLKGNKRGVSKKFEIYSFIYKLVQSRISYAIINKRVPQNYLSFCFCYQSTKFMLKMQPWIRLAVMVTYLLHHGKVCENTLSTLLIIFI